MDYHQRQLKIAIDLGDRSGEGNAYGNLGSVYYSLGDFKTGIDYYKRHLKIAKDLGDRSGEGSLYGNLGIAYYSVGDFKTAMNYHEHHLKIAKDLGDRSGEGTVYGNLGKVYCSLGDFKTAMVYHRRHLKIAKDLGDRSGEGTAYSNLGHAYYSLGDFKAAIDYHQLHLKIAKDLSDRSGEGIAYGNLGNAYYSLQDFKTAIECRQCHLEILKELSDRSGEGKEYGNLGHAYYNLGDFKTALNYHQRHLKIVKELRDRSGEADAYNNLGYVHNSLGDYKSAIDFHERTLKIARELGDRSGEGVAYGNLGNVYHNLGDFKTAKDYLERFLEIAKELGDRSKRGLAYANLGNVHQCLGDFETAIDYYELFLKIAKQLGDISGEGKAYNNLGNTHRSLGHDKTAIDYHQRHLRIVKELGDRLGEGAAYGNLGNAFRCLGEFQTAIDYHERALKIARELNDKLGEGLACSFLGFDFQCLGQFQMAIKYYQLAITLSNNLRDRLQFNDDWKISLRDRYQKIYAELWRLLLADGKVTEALFSAEQGRAQGLKDLMTLNYSFEANDVRRVKETGTFHELSSFLPVNTIFMAMGWKEVIFWVCQKGKDVKVRRKQISSQDDVKTSQDEVKTFFQSLVNKIGPRDYVKCEDRSLELAKDKRLAFERSPRDGRQTQPLHLQEAALRALYDTIIVPIQDLFSGRELVFIPEGPLCLAPFAAFMSPDSKYLCESFSIRVAPSLTSLKMIMECPVDYHHTSGVLLVGDPWVQDVTKLPTLPFARKEVEMIGKILGCKPLIGGQATKDEVLKRLGSAALVHIAAHGEMETGEIALAPKSGETDFILTMKDVKSAQIRARLVVLSCCHSARGEIKAEGVVGIARAFLGAGARSVLVSLWAIDDKATLEFMTNFYHHLVKGKSASKALNQAMNCMRESQEFSSVIEWAPFVLIGDDVTLEFGESK